MKTVSMLELRQNSAMVVSDLMSGVPLILTYRGKPLARLEPIAPADKEIAADDPFYTLIQHAEKGDAQAGALTNEQIDQILYGQP